MPPATQQGCQIPAPPYSRPKPLRLAVSLAQHWVDPCRAHKRRGTVRAFQKPFHRHATGPQRLANLIFAKQPAAWACVD